MGLASAPHRMRLHDRLHDRGHDGRGGRARIGDDRNGDRGRIDDDGARRRIGDHGVDRGGRVRRRIDDRRGGIDEDRVVRLLGGDRGGGGEREDEGTRQGERDERSCAHASRAQWSSFLPARRGGRDGGGAGAHGRARTGTERREMIGGARTLEGDGRCRGDDSTSRARGALRVVGSHLTWGAGRRERSLAAIAGSCPRRAVVVRIAARSIDDGDRSRRATDPDDPAAPLIIVNPRASRLHDAAARRRREASVARGPGPDRAGRAVVDATSRRRRRPSSGSPSRRSSSASAATARSGEAAAALAGDRSRSRSCRAAPATSWPRRSASGASGRRLRPSGTGDRRGRSTSGRPSGVTTRRRTGPTDSSVFLVACGMGLDARIMAAAAARVEAPAAVRGVRRRRRSAS